MSNYVVSNHRGISKCHYVLLTNQEDYWFNVWPSVLERYQEQYGDDFCVVLYRGGPENDAYVMPFARIKHLFAQYNLSPSSGNTLRWIGSIRNGELHVRRIGEIVLVSEYHNAFHLLDADASTVFAAQSSPLARDISEPSQPDRVKQETYRILRDTALAREVKVANQYKCQICGTTLKLKDGKPYAEAHHIKPLGAPHDGPDVKENILCVCPNDHVLLDYGAIELDASTIEGVSKEYIEYHNNYMWHGLMTHETA
jgi:hypothetical protein